MGKKPYTAPHLVQYQPDEIPKWIADSFHDESTSTLILICDESRLSADCHIEVKIKVVE